MDFPQPKKPVGRKEVIAKEKELKALLLDEKIESMKMAQIEDAPTDE